MNILELDVDEFCTWLCLHEMELVGSPGSCFQSPLACWLSERFGQVYGVDGRWYGRALYECRFWRLLPRWAELFACWLDDRVARPVTGLEALEVLAHVELTLCSSVSRLAQV